MVMRPCVIWLTWGHALTVQYPNTSPNGQPRITAMLAEIYILRLENLLRLENALRVQQSDGQTTTSGPRFVPIVSTAAATSRRSHAD